MRSALFGLAVLIAAIDPQEARVAPPMPDTYRLHVAWYESDITPMCEVLPPLDEMDSIEILVHARERFIANCRAGRRQMKLRGDLTPLPGNKFVLNIHCQLEVELAHLVRPPLRDSISTNTTVAIPLDSQFVVGAFKSNAKSWRPDGQTVFRQTESFLAVTISPGSFEL